MHFTRTAKVVLTFSFLATASAMADAPRNASLELQYRDTAKRIIDATMERNDAWKKMESLCDGIGHRLSGSPELDRAIEWAVESMRKDGQENVHPEKVMVPKWTRGNEWAKLVEPRVELIEMLGLGMSVGTPPEGVTGQVIVVQDEETFDKASDRMKGAIVLFNNPMPEWTPEGGSHYGQCVRFRGKGPKMAAEKGAIACLVRSVTAHSLRSPHTGATHYDDEILKIPAAAISTEDADMLQRMADSGIKPVITLKMDAKHHGMVPSANVIGELRGSERPDEVVVISGHLDSWDVGQGAHDDGGGCVAAMEAINVLRKLGLRPRRTIRVVLWTNEENGLCGAKQYALDHKDELAKHVGAIESDSGTFNPVGMSVQHKDADRQTAGAAKMRRILSLLEPIGPMIVTEGWSGADIGPMRESGVPLMGTMVHGETYFNYHHTKADTLDKIVPEELSKCVATMAVVSYIIADMPGRLDDISEMEPTNMHSTQGGMTAAPEHR
ncbi:MAG: M20/M25/M40 family metallo-hydrolase [Phycisphaerales bacterium]|nr:M20/M25/M40 family metallo-hydrolase [Phycisphaerales bacterium]MCB9854293.1 M20/M25/M40 family metallo-hydrolase [Phycisphaerales bacterium]MCB9863494.1 M20/M25/M40 family metallo-hydrolase [Phycisphaerales bacterium]